LGAGQRPGGKISVGPPAIRGQGGRKNPLARLNPTAAPRVQRDAGRSISARGGP
jgi:hypothetical protein